MSDGQMLDVLSKLDSQGDPELANCTLQLGDVALEFRNGRSKVPLEFAPQVARHPKVEIPGYSGPVAEAPPNIAAELVGEPGEKTPSSAEAVLAAEDYLRSQGIEVPEREEPAPGEAEVLQGRIERLEQEARDREVAHQAELAAARGGAEQEPTGKPSAEVTTKATKAGKGGSKAAKVEAKLPDGFEAETADGKPRCWARKGDGTQCANAASDGGHSCNLAAHKKLVK